MKKKKYEKTEDEIEKTVEEMFADGSTIISEGFEETEHYEIAIDKIKIPKDILRFESDEEIDMLAENIKQDGLLQPIVVAKGGTLIAGYRRFLAHKKLKCGTIKANVAGIGPDNWYRMAGIENIHRRQLSPAEEARFYSTMLKDKERFPTQKSLAEALGVREATISERLKVIGEGREYPAVKEKNKTPKAAKEKMRPFIEGSLPPGMVAMASKHAVKIYFVIKIDGDEHAKNFEVKQEIARMLENVHSKDFTEEMNIVRNDL